MSSNRIGRLARLRFSIPLIRLAWRYLEDEDTWRALDYDAPLGFFGEGAVQDFDWYMQGESRVTASDVEAICNWLAGCEYARDPDLFEVGDFWQHPRTFEHLRKGDCEDHALWAWRKFRELGLDAELVAGQWLRGGSRGKAHHAWVVFTSGGERYLLESVAKDPANMVRPFAEARVEYIPHMSVDTQFTRRVHAGYVRWLEEERARRRGARGRPEARARPGPTAT